MPSNLPQPTGGFLVWATGLGRWNILPSCQTTIPPTNFEAAIQEMDPGHRLAAYLLDYLAGKRSEEHLDRYWDRAFAAPSDSRMTR